MAFSLANMIGALKSVDVTIDNETFSVSYRPHAITPEFEASLREASDKSAGEVLPHLLATLVASADVLDVDGTPLVFSEARLQTVPTTFQKAIADAVLGDINPGE